MVAITFAVQRGSMRRQPPLGIRAQDPDVTIKDGGYDPDERGVALRFRAEGDAVRRY